MVVKGPFHKIEASIQGIFHNHQETLPDNQSQPRLIPHILLLLGSDLAVHWGKTWLECAAELTYLFVAFDSSSSGGGNYTPQSS
jgi:hypothetical protein